jgi:hypothetical protein
MTDASHRLPKQLQYSSSRIHLPLTVSSSESRTASLQEFFHHELPPLFTTCTCESVPLLVSGRCESQPVTIKLTVQGHIW